MFDMLKVLIEASSADEYIVSVDVVATTPTFEDNASATTPISKINGTKQDMMDWFGVEPTYPDRIGYKPAYTVNVKLEYRYRNPVYDPTHSSKSTPEFIDEHAAVSFVHEWNAHNLATRELTVWRVFCDKTDEADQYMLKEAIKFMVRK